MLFTPLVRPLDLLGTSELNRATNERHAFGSQSDRIFVPQLGPYYTDSMVIRDTVSGEILEHGKDYRLIHMVSAATELTAKEVDAVVYITNETISEVHISYQAIGGIYAEGSIALLEILDRFKNAALPPVYWSQIIGLPDTFPVTPHKHTIYDMEALEGLISALTSVYDSLVGRDTSKFKELYTNLDAQLENLDKDLNDRIAIIDSTVMRIESNALYRNGDILITDDATDPATRFGYGTWQRLPETFLYGQVPNGSGLPISNIANRPGYIARVTNMWEQVDVIKETSYIITANRTNINEGQSVTFTLRSTGLIEGTRVAYAITGVSAADIVEPLTGDFIVNDSGLSSITITTKEDRATEGTETLVVALKQYSTVRASVKVSDTSRAPTYNIAFTTDREGKTPINAVNEGVTFYIYINTTAVDDGTVLNMFYTGSTTANADFNASLPTSITISGNYASIPVTVKNDILTEGTENLVVSLSKSSYDASLVSNSLRINDTSMAPVYRIIYSLDKTKVSAITDVDEGVTFYAMIETENVAENTILTITQSGTITAADFNTAPPATVTIVGGKANFPMKMATDITTEGQETLTLNLMSAGVSVFNKAITINDSSSNPNTQMKFSSNSAGSNNITTSNEGDTVYLVVTTLGVPNGTVFKVIYEGSASATDFTAALPTTVTINDNRAVITYAIKADKLTDGAKVMRVRLRHNITNDELSSATLNIVDTSKASTYAAFFTSDAAGATKITTANEGAVIYGVVKTTDVGDNTTIYLATTIGGKVATVANADVSVTVPTSVVIKNNIGIVKIQLNNDMTTEGAENLIMTASLTNGGASIASATMSVKDTSLSPTYATRIVTGTIAAAATAAGAAATNITVNMNYALLVTTTNVANGTVLYIRRNAAVATVPSGKTYLPDSAWTVNGSKAPIASVTIQNNQALVPFKISLGYNDSANRYLTFGLYTAASGGSSLATSSATYLNHTQSIYFTSDAAGATKITTVNEGVTFYMVFEQTNFPVGSVLGINNTIKNVASDATDVNVAARTTLTTKAGSTIVTLKTLNDLTTEGTEAFKVVTDPNLNDGKSYWNATASLSIADTSRRAPKLRAGVVSGAPSLTGNSIDNFSYAKNAIFITPEGGHEAWSVAVAANNESFTTSIWNRSGTSRVGYSGNTSYVVIVSEALSNRADPWQAPYHNENITNTVDPTGAIAGGAVNDPGFISPYGDHEAWDTRRNNTTFSANIFNRSGTSRTGYGGKVALTLMKEYKPHYGEHQAASYPRIVMAGRSTDLTYTAYDMFNYNLQDTTKYALLFNPEGSHEAWSLGRTKTSATENAKFSASVFNRSGTSRVGYSGNNSWAVVQLKADGNLDRVARKVYGRPGIYSYPMKAGHTYRVHVIGGGGAGGNAIYYHSGATELYSDDGGWSEFSTTSKFSLKSWGGTGGSRGCWNNGSAYRNGRSGIGGTYQNINTEDTAKLILSKIVTNVGTDGYMYRYNAGYGGSSPLCPEIRFFGNGGKGMYGSGDDNWGYGGSGGGGAGVRALVKSNINQNAYVQTGAGGKYYDNPTEYYQQNWHYGYGSNGGNGLVVVEDLGTVTYITDITKATEYTFVAGRTYEIFAFAGGGAGGNSCYYPSSISGGAGGNGTDTNVLLPNAFNIVSKGGNGGTRGTYNNGSSYQNGVPGAGGTSSNYLSNTIASWVTFTTDTLYPGGNGVVNRTNYATFAGGTNANYKIDEPDHNQGGIGAPGNKGNSGDYYGWGGSGGAGGGHYVKFKALQNIIGRITVGGRGNIFNDPSESFQKNYHKAFGTAGLHGIVLIRDLG